MPSITTSGWPESCAIEVPDTTKYFCISESTAHYLQKYIVYRKRKIFHGQLRFAELMDSIKKHKKEKFLTPLRGHSQAEHPQSARGCGD